MTKLNTPADGDPALDQSRLLHALRQTIRYADEHGGIGLTQTKAFNRKFAHWAAENFDWPDYCTDKLLSIQKVLNEWDAGARVIVVTDRVDLEKQLSGTFLTGGAFGSDVATKKDGENAKVQSGRDLAVRI